ncbi:hypothetical protein Taro_004733 [Colocasia esculenta]|uniref:Serine aminopeptidase S33 domain-containing protein n=1 Tax=Colocasia esculenta TaxID=4460 RepID=A0A843TVS9_COLES|nr:hypothetical protein [Colocasia esculenta]
MKDRSYHPQQAKWPESSAASPHRPRAAVQGREISARVAGEGEGGSSSDPSPDSEGGRWISSSISSSDRRESKIMFWHVRADYSPKNDLLDQEFMLKGRWFQRKDVQVKNGKGNVLQCSHYVPLSDPEKRPLPCVIYCHGNSGCRADASEAAIILLPSNITVFTLDFSGSGLSEGEHVTLGWNEKEDLKAVVNYLRTDGNVSCIGLWGRSMGAVTSLMYGAEDPSIAGMVLDSPFSNLVDLMMELVDTYKYPLPKFTVKLAIQHMRRVIKRKANFDIMDLDTIQVAKCCFVPALFGHATDDDFIQPHHSDRIYDAYEGDKNIIKFDGDHNSPRPQFYFDSITIFFHNVLKPPKDPFDNHSHQTVHDYLGQDNWDAVVGASYSSHNPIQLPSGLSAGTTDDAINQIRLRRPMSRTEVPHEVHAQDKPSGIKENGTGDDRGPSSSRSFSFDLSNGHLDDEFVEYSFDSFSDVPSSMEEEERMLMEAVMESLRDLEVQHAQGQQSDVDNTSSLHPPDGTKASNGEPNEPLTRNGCSTSTSNSDKEEGSHQPMTSSSAECSVLEASEPVALVPPSLKTNDDSESIRSSTSDRLTSTTTVPNCEVSSSSGDSDVSAGTHATLVVHKNPSGHVLDGLIHRWGSFFKNSR